MEEADDRERKKRSTEAKDSGLEILKKQEKAKAVPKGSKLDKDRKVRVRSGGVTALKDLGITKNQSSTWQRIPKDPEAVRMLLGGRPPGAFRAVGLTYYSLTYDLDTSI